MAKRDYVRANREWLAAKAAEEGVHTLPGGVLYKVLASGDPEGRSPLSRSIITVHYTGSTIDGRTFDSSRGGTPLAIRLRELIDGWIIALQKMVVGDRWEVYIPAEKGYGSHAQPGIPAGSTLVFDIELLGIG